MKLYLASSWRNAERVNKVDAFLSARGHECFNFTRPGPKAVLPEGFKWSEIDPNWLAWDKAAYRDKLNHPIAKRGLVQDFERMLWADACVAIQPFGRSASVGVGWFVGAHKPALIILNGGEPELMFGLCDLCLDMEEAAEMLDMIQLSDGIEGVMGSGLEMDVAGHMARARVGVGDDGPG